MNRALVLACGNVLRGDDGVAVHIANCLRNGICDPETQIHSEQQWTPELAEPISEAKLVIFLDASSSASPGEIVCQRLRPIYKSPASLTHHISPATLLALADELYRRSPERAYLITVGGASFEMKEGLSDPVSHAIPHAIERVKALLSGVTPTEG
jgi:hydrogenase maturation protease